MFGLSQLHQIRGRLGRTDLGKVRSSSSFSGDGGVAVDANSSASATTTTQQQPPPPPPPLPAEKKDKKKTVSHCILLYGPNLGHAATERLKAIRATRDGFLLAERDLALRGPGEVLGVRQKGYIKGR